jgi:hypothetical protein
MINLVINLYYFLMYVIPLLGVAIFVVTLHQRKRYDRYGDDYSIYEGR